MPIFADSLHVDRELPIRSNFRGMHLSAGLAWLAEEHGLACDYRYGAIWITSIEDAKDWRDPTGVADIVPPAESQLARSWKETVSVEVVEHPIETAVQLLAQPLQIEFDTSKLFTIYVTADLRGMTFCNALGILLYQTRCRCKLEGETLVILPPE